MLYLVLFEWSALLRFKEERHLVQTLLKVLLRDLVPQLQRILTFLFNVVEDVLDAVDVNFDRFDRGLNDFVNNDDFLFNLLLVDLLNIVKREFGKILNLVSLFRRVLLFFEGFSVSFLFQ